MVDRRVAQPAALQLSSLAQPQITEITSSPSNNSVPVETGEHPSARPAVLIDDQSAIADPFFDF